MLRWKSFVFLLSLSFCLSAHTSNTSEQKKIITKLKAKYGSEANIEFQSNTNLLYSLYFKGTTDYIVDWEKGRAKAAGLLAELKPYTHITMKQIDSKDEKDLGYNYRALEITYYQKNVWGIDFQKTPVIRFTFYESGAIRIENEFAYEIVLQKRPYITKEQAYEYAVNEYIKLCHQFNHKVKVAYSLDSPHVHNYGLIIRKLQPEIDVVYYKAAYLIQFENYMIYIDAKTGKSSGTIIKCAVN